ncbi:MAG TPA: hypothetical protein VG916_15540 [Gemmatimonadaceae bacterium]|nr:hypothetical protein [Gemmatimonadaceae bacterium]
MSDAGGPRAVVAGHGNFASAMIEVVGRIGGRAEAFRAVSNDGRDGPGIEQAIRDGLRELGATVIFTDLPAGSCTIAARRIVHADPSITLVTGASVPLLLDFAFGDGSLPADIDRAAARARASIQVHGGQGSARAG